MFQAEKAVVRGLYDAMRDVGPAQIGGVLAAHSSPDWHWRGMHPFYERYGAGDVAGAFWDPLLVTEAVAAPRGYLFRRAELRRGRGLGCVHGPPDGAV